MPGGIVMPLFPPGSPFLNAKRVSEAEVYTMDPVVPGRVQRIINIHNPSIEVHLAGGGNNTGTAIILAPGGGHSTLVVGLEGADPVPYFFQYGINTIILRNRLRSSAMSPRPTGSMTFNRPSAWCAPMPREWHIDPHKIGVMGFSAGAELTMAAAIQYPEFDAKNNARERSAGGRQRRGPISSASIYPGPSLFTPAWTTRTARRRSPRTRRLPSSPAPAGRTRSMPCGRTSISPRC